MKDVRESWNEFLAKPFPQDCVGEEVGGICLTTLDTFAAGCIDTFIDRGRLDGRRTSVLKDCAKDLNVVVEHLDGDAKKYFDHLLSLTNQVLGAVNSKTRG